MTQTSVCHPTFKRLPQLATKLRQAVCSPPAFHHHHHHTHTHALHSPPNASPMHWWPMHTPNSGKSGPSSRTACRQMPESAGAPAQTTRQAAASNTHHTPHSVSMREKVTRSTRSHTSAGQTADHTTHTACGQSMDVKAAVPPPAAARAHKHNPWQPAAVATPCLSRQQKTCRTRRTWSWRHQDACRVHGPDLINRLFVIFEHHKLGTQLPKVLQVIRKGVCVGVGVCEGVWGCGE
jgi:hypothetical protein